MISLPAIPAGLMPDGADSRLARLGKLAAIKLILADRPVTRTTMAAVSASVDDGPPRVKRGFSEASIDKNLGLRSAYEAGRDWRPSATIRRRGKIDPQIMRMKKAAIATALLVARLALVEREEEFDLALARFGQPFDVSSIASIRAIRDELHANRAPGLAPAGLTARRRNVGKSNGDRIAKAAKADGGSSAASIATRTGLHVATVERHLGEARGIHIEAEFDIDPAHRLGLMRIAKWPLGRALHVERELIRAVHSATMTMAVAVIARERQEIRARKAEAL